MKELENKNDDFLKSLFKQSEMKEDIGITEKVMHHIQENQAAKSITYKPPINKSAWAVIALLISCLLLYIVLMDSSFTVELSDYSKNVTAFIGQLKNTFNWKLALPNLPEITAPYMTAVAVFNVIGLYFMLSYWRSRRI